jgi:ABC-type cobalamin/Fe3+-siderophores transport system ATPase subunit
MSVDSVKSSQVRSRPRSRARLVGIGVKNFRAFEEYSYLKLAPLSLIFGANSAGKTSILNVLKLLRQSSYTRTLQLQGRDVDLGRATELANKNTPELPTSLRIDLADVGTALPLGRHMLIDWLRSDVGDNSCGIGIEISLKDEEPQVSAIEFFVGESTHPLIRWRRLTNVKADQWESRTTQGAFDVDYVDDQHRIWDWFSQEYGARSLVAMAMNLCQPLDAKDPRRDGPLRPASLELPGVELVMPTLSQLFTTLVADARKSFLEEVLFSNDPQSSYLNWIGEEERLFSSGPQTDFASALLRKASEGLVGIAGDEFVTLLARANSLTQLEIRSWVPVDTKVRDSAVKSHPLWEAWGKSAPSINLAYDLLAVSSTLRMLLDKIEVISADRKVSQRYYVQGESKSETNTITKSSAFSRLLASKNPQTVLDKVNAKLRESEFDIQYDVVKWEPPLNAGAMPAVLAFSVRDRDNRSRSITDVGRGTQDLLPIALTLLGTTGDSENPTTLIEEPESHLHPSLQQSVGSLLASIAGGSNSTLLVETHSEALLRRVLSHVAGVRSPALPFERIAISYVGRTDGASAIEHIRIDSSGRLVDEWPFAAVRDGFSAFE